MLIEAIRALAADDADRARELNGVGFSQADTSFGHELIYVHNNGILPEERWGPALRRAAWVMLRKYTNQLADKGIDFNAIPEPPAVPEEQWRGVRAEYLNGRRQRRMNERAQARAQKRAEQIAEARRIEYRGGVFEVHFPYNQADVALVRALPRRRFDGFGRFWVANDVPENAAGLRALIGEHDFRFGDGVIERVEALGQVAEDPDAMARAAEQVANARRVEFVPGRGFLIHFPYDNADLERVRALPQRRFDGGDKVWIAIDRPENALGVRALIEQHGFRAFPGVIERLNTLAQSIEEAEDQSRLLHEAARRVDVDFPIEGLARELTPQHRTAALYAVLAEQSVIADDDPEDLGELDGVIAALQACQAFPAVVVAAPHEMAHWRDSILALLPQIENDLELVASRNGDRLPMARVYVCSNAVVASRLDDLKALAPAAVIVDRAQEYANRKAARTKAVQELSRLAPMRIGRLASGIPRKPEELTGALDTVGLLDKAGGLWEFVNKYCFVKRHRFGIEINGYRDEELMLEDLASIGLIRRTAEQLRQMANAVVKTPGRDHSPRQI